MADVTAALLVTTAIKKKKREREGQLTDQELDVFAWSFFVLSFHNGEYNPSQRGRRQKEEQT